ncbi:type II toxin-antitoxin system MqsR family toxin [Megamonas sp.]
MSSIDDIEEFLCKVRVLIANNKFRFFKKRKKNMISLALLGLTPEDIPEIIAELRYENYSSGPEDDRDREDKNCIWVFGYQYEEYEIYIKLKITTEELLNISFHIAEYPMKYPHKN